MTALFRIVAVLFVLIAAFLVYAVIHAAASTGGAKTGVAIGYIAGAIILAAAAAWMWRRSGRDAVTAGSGPGSTGV
jgi:multisubunit Na+/H+ antiporter MnhB subunit